MKAKKKIIQVKTHSRHVPISKKNPNGITIVDKHQRHLDYKSLTAQELKSIYKNYDKTKIKYPSINSLGFRTEKAYDELIAVWVDYFNNHYKVDPNLDPNILKALIASETGFRDSAPENKIAFGIGQITKQTLKILQDADGEAQDFIFKNIRQKDLLDAEINIPMATRWLFYKRERAESKLAKKPTPEEIILEYKGLLKSTTNYKKEALKNFKNNYEKLLAN